MVLGWFCLFGCFAWVFVFGLPPPPICRVSNPSTMTWAHRPHGVRTRGKKWWSRSGGEAHPCQAELLERTIWKTEKRWKQVGQAPPELSSHHRTFPTRNLFLPEGREVQRQGKTLEDTSCERTFPTRGHFLPKGQTHYRPVSPKCCNCHKTRKKS